MSYAPRLECRRHGEPVPREGENAYECPSCRDVPPLQGVRLDGC